MKKLKPKRSSDLFAQGGRQGRLRTQIRLLTSSPPLPLTAISPSQQCLGVSGIHGLAGWTQRGHGLAAWPRSVPDMTGVDSREWRLRPCSLHIRLCFTGKPHWAADQTHRTAGRSPVPSTRARSCLPTLNVGYWRSPLHMIHKGCRQVYATSTTWDIFLGISKCYQQVPQDTSSRLTLARSAPSGRSMALLRESLPCRGGGGEWEWVRLGSTAFPL